MQLNNKKNLLYSSRSSLTKVKTSTLLTTQRVMTESIEVTKRFSISTPL